MDGQYEISDYIKFENGRALITLESVDKANYDEGSFIEFILDIENEKNDIVADFNQIYVSFVDKTGSNEPKQQPAPQTNTNVKVETVDAVPTSSKILVNGKEISFEAYNINNNNNYFKLRDLAMALNGTKKNFEVTFDSAKNAINLIPNKAYTSDGSELKISKQPTKKQAKTTQSKLYFNEQEVQFNAYNIDNNNYFKLRDIGQLINFDVSWDAQANAISINTDADYKN